MGRVVPNGWTKPGNNIAAFEHELRELETLLGHLFSGSLVSDAVRLQIFAQIYETVVKPRAVERCGPSYVVRSPFHGGNRADQSWKKGWVQKQVLSHDRTVLGVSATATAEEIKSHFRALAKQAHPDAGGDPKRFLEIKTAYDNLLKSI
jgi:DnaJ-domain-containing protein 1